MLIFSNALFVLVPVTSKTEGIYNYIKTNIYIYMLISTYLGVY